MSLVNVAMRAGASALLLLAAGQAQAEAGWITDSNGCKHANPAPKRRESVSWTGPCVDGFAEGQGVQQWFTNGQAGSTFTGTLKRGSHSGKGLFKGADGSSYDGDHVDGSRTGRGVLLAGNGYRYEGEFLNGLPSGRGVEWRTAQDLSYEGDFANGKFEGRGVFHGKNGDRYEGGYANGRRSGRGIQTYANGDVYDGEWALDDRSGFGVMKFANGNRYEGQFVAGRIAGKGLYVWANGDRYEGSFFAEKPAGTGVYRFANGRQYEGGFLDGLPAGNGSASLANGKRYVGQFLVGRPIGIGKYEGAAGAPVSGPVTPDVADEFSFAFASTVSQARAAQSYAGTVCTKMGKPVPTLDWSGTAYIKVTSTVRNGKVIAADFVTIRSPGNLAVQTMLIYAISKTLLETYECPGDHVFEQEFQFNFE